MSCVGQGEGIGASCFKPLLCAPVSTWRVCLGLREREEQLVWGVETAASSAMAIISHPILGTRRRSPRVVSKTRKNVLPGSGPGRSGRVGMY